MVDEACRGNCDCAVFADRDAFFALDAAECKESFLFVVRLGERVLVLVGRILQPVVLALCRGNVFDGVSRIVHVTEVFGGIAVNRSSRQVVAAEFEDVVGARQRNFLRVGRNVCAGENNLVTGDGLVFLNLGDCDIGRVGNAAEFEQIGVLNLLGRERVRLAVVGFRPEGVGRGRIDVGRLVVGNFAELVGVLGRAFGFDVGQVERVLAGNRNSLGVFRNVGLSRRDNVLFADCDIGRVGNAADFEQVGVLNLLGRERVRLAVVGFRPEGVGRGRIDVGRLVVGNFAELVGVLGLAFGLDIGQVERVLAGNRNFLRVVRNVGLGCRDNVLVVDCDIGRVGNAADFEQVGVNNIFVREGVRLAVVGFRPERVGRGRLDVGCLAVGNITELVSALGFAFSDDIGQVERVLAFGGQRNCLDAFRNVGLSRRDNVLVVDCDIGRVGNTAEREESFLFVVRLEERVLVRVGVVNLPVIIGLGRGNVVDSVRLVHFAEAVGGVGSGNSRQVFAEFEGSGDAVARHQGEFGRVVRNVRLGNVDFILAILDLSDDALFDSGVDAVEREQSRLLDLRREFNLLGVFRVDFVAAGVVGVVVGGSGRAAFNSVEVFLGLHRFESVRVFEDQFVVARDCDAFAVDSVGCVFECVVAEREGSGLFVELDVADGFRGGRNRSVSQAFERNFDSVCFVVGNFVVGKLVTRRGVARRGVNRLVRVELGLCLCPSVGHIVCVELQRRGGERRGAVSERANLERCVVSRLRAESRLVDCHYAGSCVDCVDRDCRNACGCRVKDNVAIERHGVNRCTIDESLVAVAQLVAGRSRAGARVGVTARLTLNQGGSVILACCCRGAFFQAQGVAAVGDRELLFVVVCAFREDGSVNRNDRARGREITCELFGGGKESRIDSDVALEANLRCLGVVSKEAVGAALIDEAAVLRAAEHVGVSGVAVRVGLALGFEGLVCGVVAAVEAFGDRKSVSLCTG